METVELLLKLWPMITAIVFLIAIMAVALYRLSKQETASSALEESIKDRLYDRSGASLYMTARSCKDCRSECQARRLQDMVDIKTQISGVAGKLDDLIGFLMKHKGANAG